MTFPMDDDMKQYDNLQCYTTTLVDVFGTLFKYIWDTFRHTLNTYWYCRRRNFHFIDFISCSLKINYSMSIPTIYMLQRTTPPTPPPPAPSVCHRFGTYQKKDSIKDTEIAVLVMTTNIYIKIISILSLA